MTNIYEITNIYLYGQKTKATLVTDARIRPNDTNSPIPATVDTDSFMDSGAGRFAKAPMLDWIRKFFNDNTILPGEYTKQQIAQGIYGLSNYGWNMQQYDWKDGTDDYAERVYIYNSMAFEVANSSRFVVEANGTKYIKDFAIIPRTSVQENFDLKSSDGLAALGNPILKTWIDPPGIGRTVNTNFTAPTVDSLYTKDEFVLDQLAVNRFTKLGSSERYVETYKAMSSVADKLFANNGPTAFLDPDGRPIFYGTDASNTLSANNLPSAPYLEPHLSKGVVLISGKGADFLTGGARNDKLMGGADGDTYIVSGGNDTVEDTGIGDSISGYRGTAVETETDSGIYELGDATLTQSGGTLKITHPDGTVSLTNWSKGDYGIILEEKKDPATPSPLPSNVLSPIALDLNGSGAIDTIALSNLTGTPKVFFDLDNDGFKERVSWIRPTEGWLARDVNRLTASMLYDM